MAVFRILLVLFALTLAGCATTATTGEGFDPVVDAAAPPEPEPAEPAAEAAAAPAEESKQQEGEVPLAVAETEQPDPDTPAEIIVQGRIRTRHEAIHDLVTEGQTLLRDVELEYVLTGKGKRQVLRSEEHTSELQSQSNLVCRLLLEKKKKKTGRIRNFKE